MLLFSTEFRFPRPNNIKVLELSHNKEECFLDAIQVICERQLFIPSGSITDVQSCPKTGFFALSDDKGTVYVGNFNERFLKSRGDYFVEVIAYRLEYTESPTLTDNNLGQGPKRQKTIVFEDSNEIEQSITQRTKLLNIRKSGIQSENTYTHDKILSINRVSLKTELGCIEHHKWKSMLAGIWWKRRSSSCPVCFQMGRKSSQ
ncbi:hypothetical protein RF11_01783 [Thelohanellus kitauei]|uniref:Uncharacterized protein n=1 Tax=Thelohanellus kitauei TaxID=669202 RepID=A0A0C2MKK3_THEKT|nr:hypothetical protein RF11_01783 [Thelohanellus kitauei]